MSFLLRLLGSKALALGMIAVAGVAIVVINLPGHLSFDSVLQLYEGRTGTFLSMHPPFMGFLLGLGDALVPGSSLFVVGNVMLFCTVLALLVLGMARTTLSSNALLLAVLVSPVFVIYNGIVWKDVLFANLACLAFALIARTAKGSLCVYAALALLAMATLCRQHGLLVAMVGCGALAWMHGAGGALRRSLRALAYLALCLLMAKGLMSLIALGAARMPESSFRDGLALLLLYDISGIVAVEPSIALKVFGAAGLDTNTIHADILQHYSPERLDFLALDFPTWFRGAGGEEGVLVQNVGLIVEQWWDLLVHAPLAYLAHRFAVFGWQLGLHDTLKCLPIHLGVAQFPAEAYNALAPLPPSPHVGLLYRYAELFFRTPLFGAYAYLLVSLTLLMTIPWLRRDSGAAAMLALQTAGLVFALGYLAIGIACDFRYLYFPVLAAALGAIYFMPALEAGACAIWARIRR